MLWHGEESGNFWFSPLTSRGRYSALCFPSLCRVAKKQKVFRAEIFLLTTNPSGSSDLGDPESIAVSVGI